ncbi:MAG TPA: dihydroorotate dehydrogenase [Gaiellaceae bacterium]|jgi:dihydroorotate dehydrogenase (NAD+) catalytic subunit
MRLLNASGCLDALAAPEVARSFDAFVTKTVTPRPREGNAPVRIAETETGMLNAIGLANPGLERFLADHLPRLAELGIPIWASVGGFSAGDYEEMCRAIDERHEVTVVELNLSCPNVDEVPENVGEVVARARAETAKPLYAKLSPAVPDVAETARAAAAAGADGLSLVNTIRGLALDEKSLRPVLARGPGGLSGPALRPIAVAAVYACHQATGLPIVGMGGVATGRHALELLAAGASDVAVGTALFADPGAAGRIRAELAAELTCRGFAGPDNAVAAAHRPDPRTLDHESRVMGEKHLHIGVNMAG